ncbi:sigma-70 family RNA polymerase sigma factor [Roseomonas marmotae]|uniref:RNA polymerase sigma factor n=1 Tax=Roseomonas marmotae TaxID=2768161 RepID=A0ABS3KGC9_9PROT|nr:sigma-70 family RNA polymerase sigma factor [Roseomonas marmotae]MBO1076526.1 sigma-70 family RNA polymerase sigma factor [Roseomonas marmotae]QTI81857.1 sigma-70 family RNA polymerase sigma factor [Roseomonas marmotae]
MFLTHLLDTPPQGWIEPDIVRRAENAAVLERDRPSADDETLMAWAAAGDRLAFDQLALRHLPRLYRLAHRVTGDAGAAEEVAQEAMVRAWQAAGRFDPGRARFSTWLHRIATNLAIDHVRQAGRLAPAPGEEIPASGPDPEQQAAARERRALLAAALKEMPTRQRAALALFYDQELPGAEAAAALSVSTRALEGLLRRARRFLASRLGGG